MKSGFCISVSKNPGSFGETVHNAGYKNLGLNFQYKAFASNDILGVMKGVKALGISGCSVSMPFKETVIPYLDYLDPLAKKIGAVNTVVNKNGKLFGYNTDIIGVKESLKKAKVKKKDKVMVLGSGGASRAILEAIIQLKIKNCVISSRNSKKAKDLAKKFDVDVMDWKLRNKSKADIVINSTPIGMFPKNNYMPISLNSIKNYKLIMDIVPKPLETKLINSAKLEKIETIDGLTMSMFQAFEQFRLYTGHKAPKTAMWKAIRQSYRRN